MSATSSREASPPEASSATTSDSAGPRSPPDLSTTTTNTSVVPVRDHFRTCQYYLSDVMSVDRRIQQEWTATVLNRLRKDLWLHVRGTCLPELLMVGKSQHCLQSTAVFTYGDDPDWCGSS
jgi:hypothetical protein